jgi:hypothetical protein
MAALALIFAASTSMASAQLMCDLTSQLDSPDTPLLPYKPISGSFGTVCITFQKDPVSGTDVKVTFTPSGGFLFGGSDGVDLYVNLSDFTSAIDLFAGFTSPAVPPKIGGPFPVGDVGDFDFIAGVGPVGSAPGTFQSAALTFEQVSDPGNFLLTNNMGFDAAAHIFVCNDPSCTGTAFKADGYVGERAATGTVPEPTSVALLASVLAFVAKCVRARSA